MVAGGRLRRRAASSCTTAGSPTLIYAVPRHERVDLVGRDLDNDDEYDVSGLAPAANVSACPAGAHDSIWWAGAASAGILDRGGTGRADGRTGRQTAAASPPPEGKPPTTTLPAAVSPVATRAAT
ncbi:hypothetical protein [Amycolatopsis sp. cmx-4-83]|uniref:hypothetical protein n=1 Tax=Amycolatopsis sp. cmx-4-83 TaxID=2790940 RepID=UPI00397B2DE0